ncbi:hypothetical protein J6590_019664 [Homalodisca vitripennis]|nr:hypothetical protein J6590_019664 [Homalodisca vitripennis]
MNVTIPENMIVNQHIMAEIFPAPEVMAGSETIWDGAEQNVSEPGEILGVRGDMGVDDPTELRLQSEVENSQKDLENARKYAKIPAATLSPMKTRESPGDVISELDRQLDVDLSDDDWSDVSSIFSDDTGVDPTYRPTISDSDDEEMPFNQLSTSRSNASARPTPDNDQPASHIERQTKSKELKIGGSDELLRNFSFNPSDEMPREVVEVMQPVPIICDMPFPSVPSTVLMLLQYFTKKLTPSLTLELAKARYRAF